MMGSCESDSMNSITNVRDFFGTNAATSTCFLCFSEFSDPALTEDFSLRGILQYLGLTTLEKILGAGSILEQVEDVNVVLCGECREVSGQLTNLCEELMLLKGRVNQVLKLFHGKLVASASKAPKAPDDPVKILREKATEQCNLKLKEANVEIAQVCYVPSEENPGPSTSQEFPALLAVSSSEVKTEHLDEPDFHAALSFRLPTFAEVPHVRDPVSNLVTCTLCPEDAHSVFGRDVLFQRHICCCHLDYLFDALRVPELSEQQFRVICEHLLESEMTHSGHGVKKKNDDDKPAFVCHLCGDIFHETKGILTHLVTTHFDGIALRLVELQHNKNLNLQELMEKPRNDLFLLEGVKYPCEICGRVFAAWSSLTRHRKQPCKPGGRRPRGMGDECDGTYRNKFPCSQCGLGFASKVGRAGHIKRVHLGIDHNRDRVRCELCGKNMSKSSMGRHKTYSCPVAKERKSVDVGGSASVPVPMIMAMAGGSSGGSRRKQTMGFYLNDDLKVEMVDLEEEQEDNSSRYVGQTMEEFFGEDMEEEEDCEQDEDPLGMVGEF